MAEPKAWPKSMPIMPPVSVSIMKLERWRSPIPRIQWLTQSRAWELMKWERRERKASGLLHIFRNDLLTVKQEGKFKHAVLVFIASHGLNSLQQIARNLLLNFQEVVHGVDTFGFPVQKKKKTFKTKT